MTGTEPILERLVALAPGEPFFLSVEWRQESRLDALLSDAAWHGLAGALAERLQASSEPLPAAFQERVRRLLAAERVRAASIAAALDASLRALDAAGVRAVALKGPVLAERLYPDPALRPSTDVDLLVAVADVERACTALETAGYRQVGGPAEDWARRHHHHLSLHRPLSPLMELHFRAFTGFGAVMRAEDLLLRASPHCTSAGARTWVLAPEDEALYLCLHAAGHLFARLGWLRDLVLLLRRFGSELAWPRIVASARELPATVALAVSLERLRSLGASVADLPLRPPGPVRTALAEQVRRAALRWGKKGPRETLGVLAYQALLCDRPAIAARFAALHTGRIARRRARRWLPFLFPEDWAG